jgi:hypothetical protein
MEEELVRHVLAGRIIDVGEVKITRTTLGKYGGHRFLIYLPTTRNYLWEQLHAKGRRVRIFIELPKGVEGLAKAKAETTMTY